MRSIWILAIFGLKILHFGCCHGDSEVIKGLVEQKWSFYYEFLRTASLSGRSSECIKNIRDIFEATKRGEIWALKALDASGSISSSFIYHQNFWHGSKEACGRLHTSEKPLMSSRYSVEVVNAKAPFEMKYFTVFANYSTSKQIPQFSYAHVPVQLGFCAPAACMKNQILNVIKPLLEGNQLPFQQLYNVTFKVLAVRTGSLMNFFTREYTVGSLLGLVALIGLVLAMNLISTESGTTLDRFLNCFNLRKNFQDLTSTSRPKGSIECLDGIRSIVCIWITLMHLPFFSLFIYENAAEFLYASKDFRLHILAMALLIVDAFFVLSAFLLTYHFLRNERQLKTISSNGPVSNAVVFIKLWLHRYFRLLPALLLTMVLNHLSAVYMEEATHLYVPERMDNICRTNSWWRGILFLQSFYPLGDMCGMWTWYLSCEMVYFTVTLIALFIFVRFPSTIKVCFFLLLGCSLAYSFLVHHFEDYELGIDKMFYTRDSLYIAPLVRANPYFAGILGGYFMHVLKDFSFKLNGLLKFCWNTTEVLVIVVILIVLKYYEYVPVLIIQLVNSVGRFFCGVFLMGSIAILTFESNRGIMKAILGWKFFVHFSKLSYMTYLLYPVLIYFYRAASDTSVRLDFFNIYIEGLGLLVVCYFVSILATLFFEIPYYRLSSEFLRNRTKPLPTAEPVKIDNKQNGAVLTQDMNFNTMAQQLNSVMVNLSSTRK